MTKAPAGRGESVIADVDQGGDGEAAAGGLSREGDVRRGDAVAQEGFIGRKSVVDRCRIRVLGGESVVDGDDLGMRPPADLRGQLSGEEGVPHHVHAAVEVQNDVSRFDSVDGDLGGWDAAQCRGAHRHVGGQRLRREQLAKQSPLLVDVAADREGGLSQDRVEGLSLLGAHGGSPFGWVGLSQDGLDHGRGPAAATRMRWPHAATRARWPAFGAPGQRAEDMATVAASTSSASRRRPGSRTMATTAAAAHTTADTVNAPVKPCVSAAGRADPPSSALVTPDVETAARTARPSAPPTCWVVLSRPEARPESSAATPLVAAIVIGTNDMPSPTPITTIAGSTRPA